MIERIVEDDLVAAVTGTGGLAGVNLYPSRREGERVLPCVVFEVSRATPLGSSQTYKVDVEAQLFCHIEDGQAAHASRFEALVAALFAVDWRSREGEGLVWRGAHLGVREHGRDDMHWTSAIAIAGGVKAA